MPSRVVVVVSFLWAGVSLAEAQQSTVHMTTDKPAYKRTGPGVVKITLENEGNQLVGLGNLAPWSIWKGSQMVYHPSVPPQAFPALPPGQSKTWTWNKKDQSGTPVPSGTYTVKIGPLSVGSSSFTLARRIALTSSGNVAGASRFPLSVGNEWEYDPVVIFGPAQPAEAMKVTAKISSWFKVVGLVGATRWARLTGAQFPTLFVSAGPGSSGSHSLFKLNRPEGYLYTAQVAPALNPATFVVGDASETVTTYAGAFAGCYRLDVIVPPTLTGSIPGYASFWFARGIGLVQYGKIVNGQYVLYVLRRAKIKGSGAGADGQTFTIGMD